MKNIISLIIGAFMLLCVSINTLAAADMLVYPTTVGLYRNIGGVTLNGSHNNSVAIRKPLGLPTRVRFYPNTNSSVFQYCEVYGNATHFACRIMTDENGIMTVQFKPWSGVLNGDSWSMANGQPYPRFALPKYLTDTDAIMVWSESQCQSTYYNIDFHPEYGLIRQSQAIGGQIGILAFREPMNWIGEFYITAGAHELQFRPISLNPFVWNRDVLGL